MSLFRAYRYTDGEETDGNMRTICFIALNMMIREVFVSKMSSICGDFLELDEYEELETCFLR